MPCSQAWSCRTSSAGRACANSLNDRGPQLPAQCFLSRFFCTQHNMGSKHGIISNYNNSWNMYQFSIKYSDIELKQPLTCGRGHLVSAQLCVFHQNITCSIQNFLSRIESFWIPISGLAWSLYINMQYYGGLSMVPLQLKDCLAPFFY